MTSHPSRQKRFLMADTIDRQRQLIVWMIGMLAADESKLRAVRDALERARLGGVELCDRILAHHEGVREQEEAA